MEFNAKTILFSYSEEYSDETNLDKSIWNDFEQAESIDDFQEIDDDTNLKGLSVLDESEEELTNEEIE